MGSSNRWRGRLVWWAVVGLAFFWSTLAVGQNVRPVADAGVSRYAGSDPVQLDGSGSYDPDESGPLSYTWTQVSGPSVAITDGDTATPTISGSIHPGERGNVVIDPFVQTDEIQTCEFELVVSDGQLESPADSVTLFIVPDFGGDTLRLENPPFDPDKPTVVFFGGGNCVTGGGSWGSPAWAQRANIISFTSYGPDGGDGLRAYYRYGDMLIAYLSSVAPDYAQPIQTMGWSTGGQPAVDAGIRLNVTYGDARYAVNHVTFLDATPFCRSSIDYSESIDTFLASSVDGESCWVDDYTGGTDPFFASWSSLYPSVLRVRSSLSHGGVPTWYANSLTDSDMNQFDHGVIGGAYWSVVGPGRNLQPVAMMGDELYRFEWSGSPTAGHMAPADELTYPGRLPEPVTLVAWADSSGGAGPIEGVVPSCHESENAVGYELLFGSDPHRVAHYDIVSDTPIPPTDIIRDRPTEPTWWTVRARDAYGSTIYADPIPLGWDSLPPLRIENSQTGKRYGLIAHAILDASAGDELVLAPATYRETIDFRGKSLTIVSVNPNDPEIVASTIVEGPDGAAAVAFSARENAGCVLAGLTLTGGTVGLYCRDAAPTIRHCNVEGSEGVAIEYWHGYEPTIVDCNTVGSVTVRPFVENMTLAKRYRSIQPAIDEAQDGHELVLSEGIYFEDVRLQGKRIVLRSTDPTDASVVAATIVSGADRAVTFADGEEASCVVSGLTVADANEGFYCAEASPTISHCVATGNAIAGLSLWGAGHPRISNCLIVDNLGAGVKMVADIEGRYTYHSVPLIANCTIAGNRAEGVSGGQPTITNSIVYFNGGPLSPDSATVTYSNVEGGFPGPGNLDLDPLFADSAKGDYHLKSQAGRWDPVADDWVTDDVTSPCIDAGDPGMFVGSEPAPNGVRINMGAYGGTAQASKSP